MSDAWTFEFTRSALRDLQRLPRTDAGRVYVHLDRLIQGEPDSTLADWFRFGDKQALRECGSASGE